MNNEGTKTQRELIPNEMENMASRDCRRRAGRARHGRTLTAATGRPTGCLLRLEVVIREKMWGPVRRERPGMNHEGTKTQREPILDEVEKMARGIAGVGRAVPAVRVWPRRARPALPAGSFNPERNVSVASGGVQRNGEYGFLHLRKH